MKEQIWSGGGTAGFFMPNGQLQPISNVNAGISLKLTNNMSIVQNSHVAIFKIERNDKNEITSAKFIKEMWIETKNGSSVDFEVAKDPEISKYKADEITIRTIYTLSF
jgi:hypothetical protein